MGGGVLRRNYFFSCATAISSAGLTGAVNNNWIVIDPRNLTVTNSHRQAMPLAANEESVTVLLNCSALEFEYLKINMKT